jgi:putative PIN family toxin of toxin-antitoxin system
VLKVVLDSNVIVSGTVLLNGAPRQVVIAWREGRFRLVISSAQRAEIAGVLQRPKFTIRYGVTAADIARLLRRLGRDATVVEPYSELPITVRDIDDAVVLGTALAADADGLVTGDKDLLVFAGDERLGGLLIATPAQFLTILAGGNRTALIRVATSRGQHLSPTPSPRRSCTRIPGTTDNRRRATAAARSTAAPARV